MVWGSRAARVRFVGSQRKGSERILFSCPVLSVFGLFFFLIYVLVFLCPTLFSSFFSVLSLLLTFILFLLFCPSALLCYALLTSALLSSALLFSPPLFPTLYSHTSFLLLLFSPYSHYSPLLCSALLCKLSFILTTAPHVRTHSRKSWPRKRSRSVHNRSAGRLFMRNAISEKTGEV